ncbi:hypothetical protein [Pseudomonas sp.]|uniref:hypothetical protein n=1 Tax=Pseudomonas sp. TaxID=306 RepID=UPI002588E51E|nr:hypothetical protein [Pseudomonas sp.]
MDGFKHYGDCRMTFFLRRNTGRPLTFEQMDANFEEVQLLTENANALIDNANVKANEAATSASAAADSVAAIAEYSNRNYGPLAVEPLTRPDGSPVQIGDTYFNILESVEYIYGNTGWYSQESAISDAAAIVVAESEQARDEAEAAASEAANARDAALATGKVYDTVAIGLAASASGSYFSVPSADGAEYLILYKNNAGVALEVKRYPSSSAVTAVTERIPLRERRGWVHAVRSADGKLGLGINALGHVIFGVGGNIHQRLLDLLASINSNSAQISTLQTFIVTRALGRSAPFSVRDSSGKVPLYVTRGGRLIARGRDVLSDVDSVASRVLALESGAIANKFISPSQDITLLGDSQIAGAGATPWRTQIVDLISARNYRNLAIGGQTSTQIAARFGAVYALLSVTNDQIPASGSVAVTACRVMKTDGSLASGFTPLTDQGAQTLSGTLMGVPGTLTRDSGGGYSFTRTADGSAVNCLSDTPFKPSWPDYDHNLMVIGLGRNNITDLTTIKRDIEACVDAQRTIEKRQIILTVTNGGPISAGAPTTEGIGSTVGDNVVALENWAESRFTGPGVVVVNVRKLLMPLHDGSADDLADVAAGTVPRSLRIDSVHYSEAAHAAIAAHIASLINARGW